MKSKIIIFLSWTFILVVCSSAKIIKVPENQPTIQSGINAAVNGDTIVVYPGIYYENIFYRGKNIVLTSRFYETGDLNLIKTTIINGSQPTNPDSASCVHIIKREDSTAVLQGFTITGGKGTKWKDEHSAGTYREGGGVMVALSSPIIRYNIIINNEAIDKKNLAGAGGGGIRCGDGNAKILNNVIANNNGRYGGGIVLNWCGAIIRNNIIAGNDGGQDYGSGGIWINKSNGRNNIIENNTIVYNHSFTDGGGILLYSNTTNTTIKNNIIYGNTAKSYPQISLRQGASVKAVYCNIEGGWSGNGNINNNPQFEDSLFHLSNSSACIDAGDSSDIYNDVENPSSTGNALFPSNGTIRNDMGAYGGPGAGILPDFGTITEVGSLPNILPDKFSLEQNYPNPFNPSTVISYRLSVNSFVTLKIYDALGREITTLADETMNAGYHETVFNGSDLSSGIYIYRLISNTVDKDEHFVKSAKMMLIK